MCLQRTRQGVRAVQSQFQLLPRTVDFPRLLAAPLCRHLCGLDRSRPSVEPPIQDTNHDCKEVTRTAGSLNSAAVMIPIVRNDNKSERQELGALCRTENQSKAIQRSTAPAIATTPPMREAALGLAPWNGSPDHSWNRPLKMSTAALPLGARNVLGKRSFEVQVLKRGFRCLNYLEKSRAAPFFAPSL